MQGIKSYSLKLLRKDFVRFCLVGIIGFIVNALLLRLFFDYIHLRIYIAQALAAEIALFSNFILHHNWTYKKNGKKKTIRQLLIQFHATSWVAIIGSALIVSIAVNNFDIPILLALVISSVTALFWNFFWTKYIIWQKLDTKQDERKGEE